MVEGYVKQVLVTTDWLAERLDDDGVVVAEVDENPDLYDEGHIPGAVKLHWRTTSRTRSSATSSRRPEFEQLMGSRGIANDTTVVLYGDKNNWFAAYAYWYLKIYGHQDVRILDGGRQKWIDEGRELTDRRAVRPRRVPYTAPGAPTSRSASCRDDVLGTARRRRVARSSTCAARRSTRAS